MAELNVELLQEPVKRAASKVHRAYQAVPLEDLEQAIWADVLGDPVYFNELNGAKLTAALMTAAWRACKEDDRYRRAAKAAAAGYAVQDESFYSIGQLRRLIPQYLDNGITESPPAGREIRPERNSDPAAGKGWLVAMLDIQAAFEAVRQHHADILSRYFSYPQGRGGWTHLEIAGALGIEPGALKNRVYRALRAVQRQLGGANPWDKRRASGERWPGYPSPVPCEQNRGSTAYETDPRPGDGRALTSDMKWEGYGPDAWGDC